jgi:hypothetical protein
MLNDGIRILSVKEDTSFDPDTGDRKAIIRVTWKTGAHGPFVDRFDKETFSESARDDRLNAFARMVLAS